MLTTKRILNVITLFASVQVAIILTQIIRSKFISIYLGPEGIGLFSIYNSLFSFFFTLIGLGLSQGILNVIPSLIQENVKEVNSYLPKLNLLVFVSLLIILLPITVFKDLISTFLSKNIELSDALVYLTAGSIFTALATLRMSFIQSYKLNDVIVRVKLLHAILSTGLAVILIYFFRYTGILLSIILGSIIHYIVTLIFSKRIINYDFDIKNYTIRGTIGDKEFKLIFVVGITLLLGQFIGQIISNYGNVLVLNTGDINEVGYWTAARTILLNYTGLIFVALNLEFLPRISSFKNDNVLLKNNIELQIKALNLITLLLSVSLFVFSDIILKILYSSDFIIASSILKLSLFSIPFNGVTYTLAYLHLIKDFKIKYVILNSILPGVIFMILGYILNKTIGLIGLGLTLSITSILHYIFVIYYTEKDFQLKIKNRFDYNFIISIIILASLGILELSKLPNILTIKISIFIVTLVFCLKQYMNLTLFNKNDS